MGEGWAQRLLGVVQRNVLFLGHILLSFYGVASVQLVALVPKVRLGLKKQHSVIKAH